METYRALVVRETEDGFERGVETVPLDFLPPQGVLVRVAYAALNYKDALSASGHKGITQSFPHTPGVDAAGVVVQSGDAKYPEGTRVIVTSYDLGMNTKGAFAEYIRVPPEWIVPLPPGMSLKDAMIIGTAGYTASLAVHKMRVCGQYPDLGPIAVTGASGAVGSMAVAILAKIGFAVTAVSGKEEHYDWLTRLGAERCIPRGDVDDLSGKPLLRSRWAGAIDTVGGNTLATLLKACARNGNVASCGLVSSPELLTTVYPFILNGINLLGIDSAETPMTLRLNIWNKLVDEFRPPSLEEMATFVGLEEVSRKMDDLLNGESVGQVVVDMNQ